MEEHPGCAEFIPEHGKAVSKKRLLYRHEDLTAIGKKGVNAISFFRAVEQERKVRAAHRLKTLGGNVGGHEDGLADLDSGVKNGILPIRRDIGGIRTLAVGDLYEDLSSEVLFIETECLLAVSAVVEIV